MAAYSFQELLNKKQLNTVKKINDMHDPRTGRFAPKGGGTGGVPPAGPLQITTIFGETKTVDFSGTDLYGNPMNAEQFEWWKRNTEAQIYLANNSHEFVKGEKHIYAPYQKGTANKDNFMWETVATFEKVDRRPRKAPDYVSRDRDGNVSSEYWYTDDGVIRGSKHWGVGVASCDWAITGIKGKAGEITHTNKIYGKANWSDFTQKTQTITIDGEKHKSNFENTVGRNEVKINGKVYEYNKNDRAWNTFDKSAPIEKYNDKHDKLGRFAQKDGTGSSGWSSKLEAEKQEVLGMKPNKQAMYVLHNDGETYDNCVAAMRSGQTEALVNNYFAIMEANGDPTPTNPTSKQLGNKLKEDVDSGKYSDYDDARKDYIKELSGQNDEQAAETYKELNTWFSNRWDKADTATLDKYIESDHVFDGEMYRGMHFDEENYHAFMKDLSPGATIHMEKNSSWTSDKEMATVYSHRGDDNVHSVTIKCVKNRTSAPVNHLSHQGEDEVLAKSSAKWTVLHVETVQRSNGVFKTEITVVETGD